MGVEHEVIIPDDRLPFKIFQFEGKDGHYIREKHWHHSVEIFAVFQGTLDVYINEEKYALHNGEFVLLNSNEVHSIYSPFKNSTIVLQIPINIFKNYYNEEGIILFTHSPRTQDSKIMNLVDKMYGGVLRKEEGYEWKVQSEFFMLVYLLITKYRKQIAAEEIKRYRKLKKLSTITDYIKENYEKELSLEKLAEVFGYSSSYLSRMFQKYAGINYKSYLQNLRVEHAFRELIHTDYTIATIAMNNGFPNSKAFSTEFQKKYGMLPSESRKRQKQEE